jgi:hypothetical protein
MEDILISSAGPGLSKSLILKGIQCFKALYLAKNPPDFAFPPQPDREARYRTGTEVGLLAQRLFPGGAEVPYEGLSVTDQVARTRELIEAGVPVIYEASFAWEGIFVKVDILVRAGSSWEIHEVKMATAIKRSTSTMWPSSTRALPLRAFGLPVPSRPHRQHLRAPGIARSPSSLPRRR